MSSNRSTPSSSSSSTSSITSSLTDAEVKLMDKLGITHRETLNTALLVMHPADRFSLLEEDEVPSTSQFITQIKKSFTSEDYKAIEVDGPDTMDVFLKTQSDSSLEALKDMISHLKRNSLLSKRIWTTLTEAKDTNEVEDIALLLTELTNTVKVTRNQNIERFLTYTKEQRAAIANGLIDRQPFTSVRRGTAASFISFCNAFDHPVVSTDAVIVPDSTLKSLRS